MPPFEPLQETTLSRSCPGLDLCTRVVDLVSVAVLEHRVSVVLEMEELFRQMRVAHAGANAVLGVEDVIPHLPYQFKQCPAFPHRDSRELKGGLVLSLVLWVCARRVASTNHCVPSVLPGLHGGFLNSSWRSSWDTPGGDSTGAQPVGVTNQSKSTMQLPAPMSTTVRVSGTPSILVGQKSHVT